MSSIVVINIDSGIGETRTASLEVCISDVHTEPAVALRNHVRKGYTVSVDTTGAHLETCIERRRTERTSAAREGVITAADQIIDAAIILHDLPIVGRTAEVRLARSGGNCQSGGDAT